MAIMSQMILIGAATPPRFRYQELYVSGADELAMNSR
jgi:hypothetical protein